MMIENKKDIKRVRTSIVGYTNECFVMYELAKRGIRCQRMDISVVDFDFITDCGERIEVKSSAPIWSWNGQKTQKTLTWNFNNQGREHVYGKGVYTSFKIPRDRNCDFFIFVGMDWDLSIKKVFIVPKEEVGTRSVISEPVERKRKTMLTKLCLSDWENKWDLINSSHKARKEKGK